VEEASAESFAEGQPAEAGWQLGEFRAKCGREGMFGVDKCGAALMGFLVVLDGGPGSFDPGGLSE
jgi:hypothetical protein